jgi:hypothetical protein
MDLIALHDNRLGLRTLLQVDVREPSPQAPLPSDGRGEPSPTVVGQGEVGASSSSTTLDFIASTATLDRYLEVIEPAGWRLEAYGRIRVFRMRTVMGTFFSRSARRW